MEDVTNNNNRKIAKAIHFKLKVKIKPIKHYEKSKNFCLTATTFSTSRNNITNWYKNKEAILDSYNQSNRFRVRSKKDRSKHKDMEAELVEVIKTMRENGGIFSGQRWVI